MLRNQLNIADIIFSYIRGTISEKDKLLLDKWIKSSPENEKLFASLCLKKSFEVKSELYKSFELQNRYSHIERTIRRKSNLRMIYRYSSIAAAVLLPILIVLVLVKYPKQIHDKVTLTGQINPGKSSAILYTSDGKSIDLEKEEFVIKDVNGANIENKNRSLVYKKDSLRGQELMEKISRVEVPRGGEYNMVLSDGTKVWLNSESSIKYPIRFLGKNRIVRVSGEVYFDVAHDKQRPFIVVANNAKIEVLGTEFNIRAYNDEDYIATTLVEGKVRTWTGNNKPSVLEPSQQYVLNKKTGSSKITKVDIEQYIAWKNGLFVFNRRRLEDILNIISKWYDVEIFFEVNSLRDIVFSGRLKKYDNAEALLKIFEEMEDVKFKIKGKIIYVRKK